MYQIQQITSDAKQRQRLVLPDGSSLVLQLYFRPMQAGWFVQSLIYAANTASYGPPSDYTGPFTINELRVTNSPNMLNQFRNQIPFGLACFSTQDREPTQQQDFSSGASKLYLLSQEEVTLYAELLAHG